MAVHCCLLLFQNIFEQGEAKFREWSFFPLHNSPLLKNIEIFFHLKKYYQCAFTHISTHKMFG